MKKILIIKDGLEVGGTTSSFLSLINMLNSQNHQYEISIWINGINGIIEKKLVQNWSRIRIITNDLLMKSFCRPKSPVKKMWELAFSRQLPLYFKMKRFREKDANNRKLIMLYQEMDIKRAKYQKKADFSEYDMVITWEELFPLYFLAESVINCKKIAWIHPDYIQCGFDASLDKNEFKKIDKIVAVSKNGMESLKSAHPEMKDKFAYVYNSINTEAIRKIAKETSSRVKFQNKSLNFLTVARLQNISKALDRAVTIALRLKNDGLKFHWYFIGEGEDRSVIEQFIVENGLMEYVTLLGEVNNPYDYMAKADIFVLQSYYEGRPVVVDEAMIVGTPVLVSDYKGAKEQVHEEYGWVVPNDENNIYESLKSIIGNPDKLKEKKKNLEKLDLSIYSDVSSVLEIFNEVLENVGENR